MEMRHFEELVSYVQHDHVKASKDDAAAYDLGPNFVSPLKILSSYRPSNMRHEAT